MLIEIHQPELKALIQLHLDSGRYQDVEDVLLQALASSGDGLNARSNSLLEVFSEVRGLGEDLDFSRDPSPGRSIDLS